MLLLRSWGFLLVYLLGIVTSANVAYAQKSAKVGPTRTLGQIKKKLAELATIPAGKKKNDAEKTLNRLKAYRFLAEVPYEDIVLDDELNKYAEAAARVCAKLGRLDHKPPNPGLPEEEYQLGLKGAGGSNLGMGYASLADALDAWMDDSDASNIDRLGHRRWCLNPGMQKIGLGLTGNFTAMYIFGPQRRMIPDFDFISWPARGLMPVEFFGAEQAWHVSLNPKKYEPPSKEVKVRIQAVNVQAQPVGEPRQLNYFGVNTDGFGVPYCVIFRPAKIAVVPGARYQVDIDGLKRRGAAASVPLRFLVEFVTVK